MPAYRIFRFIGGRARLSELVMTTEARNAPHALLIAFEVTCPGDNVEQRKLYAQRVPEDA